MFMKPPTAPLLAFVQQHRIALAKTAFIFLAMWCLLTPAPAASGYTQHGSAGTFTYQNDQHHNLQLPLKQTKVHLEITGDTVHSRVSQTFFNDRAANLEALYRFPLPDNATVTDMMMRVGKRIIRGEVQEKVAAQKTYEAAKSSGRRTSLLEQKVQNLFETRVANIQPGEEVTITFSYLAPLARTDNRYELVFPTVFGRRYHMQHSLENDAGESHYTLHPMDNTAEAPLVHPPLVAENANQHFVTLTATIEGIPAADILSPSHDIFVDQYGDRRFAIELSPVDNLPNRDFVLQIEPFIDEEPQLSLVQSQGHDGVHGMLTVYPPLEDVLGEERTPKDLVFLIDTSGSMDGQPLAQAKQGLKACLAMLNPRDRFNIVRFSSDYSSYTNTYDNADGAGLDGANTYIDGLASGGGTELQIALSHVLDLPESPERVKMVVVLTDGDVGNETNLLALVHQRLGNARLFSFGIGSAPNEHLLNRISEQGQGVANFLRANEDIGQVVAGFMETVNTPVLTDVTIDMTDLAGNPIELDTIYPGKIPDLFLGRPLRLLFTHHQALNGHIAVGGYLNGRWVQYDYAVQQGRSSRLPGLEKLIGAAQVKDLTAAYVTADYDTRPAIREQIVAIGLQYQLVTQFTSRVAVEERLEKQADGSLVSVRVPVMRRANALPATATNDFNMLLLACLLIAIAVPVSVLQHVFNR